MPTVLRPFPRVTVHVVKAKRVGTEAVHRHSGLPVLLLGASVVAGIPVEVGLRRCDAVTPPESGLCPAPGFHNAMVLADVVCAALTHHQNPASITLHTIHKGAAEDAKPLSNQRAESRVDL